MWQGGAHCNGVGKYVNGRQYQHNPIPSTLDQENQENNNNFYAPYHPLAHNLFKKLQQKFNIQPSYQKTPNLKNILYHNRPSLDPLDKPGAVYLLPCSQCPKMYIGETKRPTKIRIREEQRDIRMAQQQPLKVFTEDTDFGYVHHLKETNHNPDFNNARVLKLEQHNYRRKLKLLEA